MRKVCQKKIKKNRERKSVPSWKEIKQKKKGVGFVTLRCGHVLLVGEVNALSFGVLLFSGLLFARVLSTFDLICFVLVVVFVWKSAKEEGREAIPYDFAEGSGLSEARWLGRLE